MNAPRALVVGACGLVLAAVMMAAATGVVSASLLGNGPERAGGGSGDGADLPAGASARSAIPAGMLSLYQAAADTCPGLPWTVLAAIGTVESANGTSSLPGVHSGSNGAGAEGPMQFEPRTFAAYDEPIPLGGADPPSPYDPTDAVYAAADMLCANGASGGSDLSAAVFSYNHAASYVAKVLALAQSYAGDSTEVSPPPSVAAGAAGAAGGVAVSWALAQVGTPYIWGGETPGVGFDCSGLTQAAYRVAGVAIPRVAQDQFDAAPRLAAGTILQPGDLVFFGDGPRSVSHVGLYIGINDGHPTMVDAPHSGAAVRIESFPTTPGVGWGQEEFVGATRPDA